MLFRSSAASATVAAAAAVAPAPAKKLDVKVEICRNSGILTINTPKYVKKPLHLICVMDVSGSMGDAVGIQTASGTKESNGFTRCDIARHALHTFANSLTAGDSMTLIKFSDKSYAVFVNVEASQFARVGVHSAIESLVPNSSTNIWDALRLAFQVAERNHIASNPINTAIVLLTDGQPTTDPVGGYLQALESVQRTHRIKTNNSFLASVYTLGFGNDINSELLYQIASVTGGTYNFIPDAGFVGTICCNLLANLIYTYASCAQLNLTYANGDIETINLGPIQYNHHRTEIIPLEESGNKIVNVSLRYNYNSSAVDLGFPGTWPQSEPNHIIETRFIFLKQLKIAITSKTQLPITELVSNLDMMKLANRFIEIGRAHV